MNYRFLTEQNRARCLDRGRRVHEATHADDLGQLCESTVDTEIWAYLLAWRKFRSDYGFQPRLIEEPVFHPQYLYAGRLDRTGQTRDGSELIVDIKSGSAPDAARLQLSAYNACLLHPRTRQRRCVELHANATYTVIPYATSDYQRDLNTFLAVLETFKRGKV